MAVNIGDGVPKALRCWLEHIEKHPPHPNVPISVDLVALNLPDLS